MSTSNSLRPTPPKGTRVNTRLVLGGVSATVLLFAAGFWLRGGSEETKPATTNITIRVETQADRMVENMPRDYAWMKEEPKPAPSPPSAAVVPAVRVDAAYPLRAAEQPAATTAQVAGKPKPKAPAPLYFPAGTIYQQAEREHQQEMAAATGQLPEGGVQRQAPAPQPAPAQPRDRREDFAVRMASDTSLYHSATPEALSVNDCVIPAGYRIPAVLSVGINTDAAGSVSATVSRDVYDWTGTCKAILAGSVLSGQYDHVTGYGQARVAIAWTVLTTPDGKTVSLAGMSGTDAYGTAGVAGDVNNHVAALLGSALLGSLVDAAPAMAGLKANVAIGVAEDVSSAGRDIIRRELERQPTITVPAGTEVTVDVRRHLAMGGI